MCCQTVRTDGPAVQNNPGEAIALRPGEAVAQICSGAVSAEVDVVVARVAQIRTEVSPGGLLVHAGSDSAAISSGLAAQVSNIADAGPLVVLLRFFSREDAEFLSGPFHAQNIQFDCQPQDAALSDFFTFEV